MENDKKRQEMESLKILVYKALASQKQKCACCTKPVDIRSGKIPRHVRDVDGGVFAVLCEWCGMARDNMSGNPFWLKRLAMILEHAKGKKQTTVEENDT